jgi:type II secretory ATPase GspE/PulE/Tfp pilus assembly ATPase PilB-like protein
LIGTALRFRRESRRCACRVNALNVVRPVTGDVAVMEVIPVGETLRELIARKASFAEILECVQRDPNLFTMYQEGLKRVLQKTTTFEEIAPLRAAFN